MDYHVVRMNEKIDQIALTYNLSIDEIKSNNQHIRDWEHLIAGTRINLPPIPNALSDEINDVEPFIEEYYPKIMSDFDNNESLKQDVVENEQIEKNNDEKVVKSTTEKPKLSGYHHHYKQTPFYNGYYPLYPPYYPYYTSYGRRKRNSTNY